MTTQANLIQKRTMNFTQPVLSSSAPKSGFVVLPLLEEVHCAILSSLNHLDLTEVSHKLSVKGKLSTPQQKDSF